MKKFAGLLAVLVLAGCAAAPEATENTNVSGVDVWTNGAPSRPYHVIAEVSSQGGTNSASFSDEINSIALQAAGRDADGVIVLHKLMIQVGVDPILGRPVMVPKVIAELIKYE
ncbi:MAG: hypothetical protein ABSE62_09010 [Chthoniobacteraceae bacterium]